MTTPELRKALYSYLFCRGNYICHEVAIPSRPRGRVDMMLYTKSYREKFATLRNYEMKISVADFHSPNGHNFTGLSQHLPVKIVAIS